ncbi:putative hydrolase of the HAD superfamily [Rhizomicrobium palustre]|uniref:Putative hydrolase of the HAD superfamily n=1 Tax=Rhizomicrobium palustre TaxID=189966 RepID=A0A846MY04_9PROT|nr:pyrimidine 5'-nucleotidase [Rhizomicrobium palustre]NIK87857.1 putative hydrolase of the HAD superfamily [Rhizomicrobium palustre]
MDMALPDFRHVDSWIFDLDNTLYRADSNLFAEIESRMNSYIMAKLALSEAEAKALRSGYYRTYGSTLSGLIAHHNADPEDFLCYVHDIDLSGLKPEPGLAEAIEKLPGKRFVFTNGCRNHALRVLEKTGLSGLMHGIWDIRSMRFQPKPQPDAYRRILEVEGLKPERAAMFEDMAVNLLPAHDLGMTTVWIANGSAWSDQGPDAGLSSTAHIHHTIDDLGNFLQTIRL